MIHEKFYEELGKFLYALALSDGSIHEREIEELEEIILDELSKVQQLNNHPEYKKIIITKLSFYNCIRQNLSVKKNCTSFLEFIQKYEKEIDQHQKMLASKLIQRVTDAYKGRNKPEKKLVADAENILQLRNPK